VAAGAELLFEYRPARFGPMTVALLFILALATPIAAVDRAFAGRLDQAAVALLPLALIALFGVLTTPSPLRIEADAIQVSRSRIARMLGARERFPLGEVVNIYPSFYEDAGMRFSPFASAEGTARHAGLRIELQRGERVVIPFTPTVLNLRKHGTEPYHAALDAVREVCRRAGRPLVQQPPALNQKEIDEILVGTSKPLLAFPLTVAGIFAPALLIPGMALLWGRLAGALSPEATVAVVLVGLAPLVAVFALVNLRSGRRAELLHEVQKFRQHRQEAAARGAPQA
jgi:hypothetical protein